MAQMLTRVWRALATSTDVFDEMCTGKGVASCSFTRPAVNASRGEIFAVRTACTCSVYHAQDAAVWGLVGAIWLSIFIFVAVYGWYSLQQKRLQAMVERKRREIKPKPPKDDDVVPDNDTKSVVVNRHRALFTVKARRENMLTSHIYLALKTGGLSGEVGFPDTSTIVTEDLEALLVEGEKALVSSRNKTLATHVKLVRGMLSIRDAQEDDDMDDLARAISENSFLQEHRVTRPEYEKAAEELEHYSACKLLVDSIKRGPATDGITSLKLTSVELTHLVKAVEKVDKLSLPSPNFQSLREVAKAIKRLRKAELEGPRWVEVEGAIHMSGLAYRDSKAVKNTAAWDAYNEIQLAWTHLKHVKGKMPPADRLKHDTAVITEELTYELKRGCVGGSVGEIDVDNISVDQLEIALERYTINGIPEDRDTKRLIWMAEAIVVLRRAVLSDLKKNDWSDIEHAVKKAQEWNSAATTVALPEIKLVEKTILDRETVRGILEALASGSCSGTVDSPDVSTVSVDALDAALKFADNAGRESAFCKQLYSAGRDILELRKHQLADLWGNIKENKPKGVAKRIRTMEHKQIVAEAYAEFALARSIVYDVKVKEVLEESIKTGQVTLENVDNDQDSIDVESLEVALNFADEKGGAESDEAIFLYNAAQICAKIRSAVLDKSWLLLDRALKDLDANYVNDVHDMAKAEIGIARVLLSNMSEEVVTEEQEEKEAKEEYRQDQKLEHAGCLLPDAWLDAGVLPLSMDTLAWPVTPMLLRTFVTDMMLNIPGGTTASTTRTMAEYAQSYIREMEAPEGEDEELALLQEFVVALRQFAGLRVQRFTRLCDMDEAHPMDIEEKRLYLALLQDILVGNLKTNQAWSPKLFTSSEDRDLVPLKSVQSACKRVFKGARKFGKEILKELKAFGNEYKRSGYKLSGNGKKGLGKAWSGTVVDLDMALELCVEEWIKRGRFELKFKTTKEQQHPILSPPMGTGEQMQAPPIVRKKTKKMKRKNIEQRHTLMMPQPPTKREVDKAKAMESLDSVAE